MVFQTFWAWLTARLASYVSVHVAAVAAALEPAAVTFGVIYVMAWGYLHLRGQIDEPILDGLIRLLTLVVAFGVGLRLWLFHDLVVDTFFSAPAELGAALVGASDPVVLIDSIWAHGGAVAGSLWDRGGMLSGDVGFYLAATAVYLLVGVVCVYAMFPISLSRVAICILLAVAPLFIVLVLFRSTRRFFDAWIHELSNYALVSVLTIAVAALMLDLVDTYAAQTAARGNAVLTVDALDLALVCGLVSLVLRQVLPIAARLSGGGSLSDFGALGSVARRVGALAGSVAASTVASSLEESGCSPEGDGRAMVTRGRDGRGP
jgi:type IV secretion system protein VirB6